MCGHAGIEPLSLGWTHLIFLLMGLSLMDKTFSTKYHIKGNTARKAFKPRYVLSNHGTCSSISDTSSNKLEDTSDVFLVPRCVSGVQSYVEWVNNDVCNDWFKFLTNVVVSFSRIHYHTTHHGQ